MLILIMAANVILTPIEGGDLGKGKTAICCNPGRKFKVELEGKQYTGKADYVEGGGGMGFVSAGSTVAPVFIGSLSGSARVTLSEPGGDYLRCEYQYGNNGNRGLGRCTRKDGKVYDLTIR
jgi:hypothetical protein